MPEEKTFAREHDATGDAAAVRSSRSLRGDSGAAAFMVEQRWEQRRRQPATGQERVVVSPVWGWPVAVVALLLVAAAVAGLR